MIARTQQQEYRKLNKGLFNAEDVETLPSGYTPASRNAVPLQLGGYKKRGGTKKMMAAQNDGKIVAMPYFEDRYFNKNKLVIENTGKFSKWNSNNSITDYSSQVVLKAAEKYGTAAFYKGVSDYLIIANGVAGDYVKKIEYTPNGSWSELGTTTGGADDITGIHYVSDTEIYAFSPTEGTYLWNGSAWSAAQALVETLTIHNYFALEGTDYVYAATSGGVYVYSDTWGFWHLLGTDTDEYFDVLAISTSEVYAVKDTKIRKYTTSWADVQTIGSATDYGIYYLNSTFIVIEKGTVNFWTSSNGVAWTARNSESNDLLTDVCTDGSNYIFTFFNNIRGVSGICYTTNFTSFTVVDIETSGYGSPSVAFGNGYYNILFTAPQVPQSISYYSNNLSTWIANGSAVGVEYRKMRYFNNEFWFFENNTTSIFHNVDGTSAFESETCSTKCDYLSFANGQFRSIGLDTTVKQVYSADGSTWLGVFTHYIYVSDTEQYGCKSDGVFKFDGSSWAELTGGETLADVAHMAYVSSGEIYAATLTGLYKWIGTEWVIHQNIIGSNDIRKVIYVSPTIMYCAVYGSGVWIYNGSVWTQLIGTIAGSDNTTALAYSAGKLFAGIDAEGVFEKVNTIWNTKNLGDTLPTETSMKKITITATSGTSCEVTSTADLYPGCFLKHASIPDLAYVVSVTDADTFVINTQIPNTTYTDVEVIYAPIAKFVTVYNNMVWLANLFYSGRAEPSQVAIANIGDMDDWRDVDQTSAGLSGFRIIQFGTGESDVINGIAAVNSRLVVFKGRSTYSVSSTAPDSDNTTSQKIADVGCVAGGSIQVVTTKRGDLVIFLSEQGFYATDGSNVFPVGESLTYNMNSTLYSSVSSVYDRKRKEYRVCIPSTSSSTECDLTLMLDLDNLGWWESSLKSTAQGMWDGDAFYAYDRWIMINDDDYSRDNIQYDDAYWSGDQIETTYTVPINTNRQMTQKELRKIYFQFDGATTVDAEIYDDNDVLQQTLTDCTQDTRYMCAVKGKNWYVKIIQNDSDSTFRLYGVTVEYKLLTER